MVENSIWRQTIEQWLAKIQQVWLTGAPLVGALPALAHAYPSLQREESRIRRVRRFWQDRGVRLLKRSLRIQSIRVQQDQTRVELTAAFLTQSLYRVHKVCWEEESEEYRQFVLRSSPKYGMILEKLGIADPRRIAPKQACLPSSSPMEMDPRRTPSFHVQTDNEKITYQRYRAVAYAELHWDHPNDAFRIPGENQCTNFVSQCLYAGGLTMECGNGCSSPGRGWWYKAKDGKKTWSYSWVLANSLHRYLRDLHIHRASSGLRVQRVNDVHTLAPGDVVCYDWKGTGVWGHNTIVTAKDPLGDPLVHAQSVPSRYRNWRYLDSPAWEPQTKYAFLKFVQT